MTESAKSKFLRILLQVDGHNPYQLTIIENEWSGPNFELLAMIERFYNNKSAVLPFRNGNNGIFWFLFTDQDTLLVRHARELDKFLLPYYVTPLENGKKQYFNPQKRMAKLGYELFPEGYFGYVSNIQNEQAIWNMLGLWRLLTERRPSISYDELEINVFTLRSRFHQAIALKKWEQAKETLTELQQGRYLTDENYKFLTIQWLSAQGKWERIWESNDFELLAGVGKLPNQVHIALLRAFYQRILSKTDILGHYNKTMEIFKENRSKLGTLLYSQLGLDEDSAIRVFAYESAYKGQAEKLKRYLEKTEDDLTKDIIEFLLICVETNKDNKEPSILPILSNLELAQQSFANQEYEDAFIFLDDCELSVEKVRLLTGIAMMQETEETCSVAFEHYKNLSEYEQRLLMQEPQSKGWIVYLLNRQNGNPTLLIKEEPDEKLKKLNWNYWFNAFLEGTDFDRLEEELTVMDTQHGNIVWSISSLSKLSDMIAMVGVESLSSPQKRLLQTALPMFITELLQDERFPNEKATDLYEYTRETLYIHGKRNENNAGFLLRLTEGLLLLDMTKANVYWNQVESWFHLPPTDRISSYVLEALELFKEYGHSDDRLQSVWTNWCGTLLDRISAPTVIHSWFNVGKSISADPTILAALVEKISAKTENDPLVILPSMLITIYSLREKPAQRAANRIMSRNPNLKVRICTDSKLTPEAKSYARNSDLIILVTTCMSHALTYGISPFVEENLVYARSSGETGIIEALEQYVHQIAENQEVS
ncbi:protein DpdD [Bacillus sp. 165]|uniref:protein DpdD n=1 Tax=Bacillus sp. 165 TaxID=1529117 RepID=UPI001ADBB708|nr:protein DpdD [Bacillus sp. 165]MBO9128575.1 hypothetical protein [Bacillus sp. 165]